MQIIVLGTHRSGTSLVTRLINMMGAYFSSGGNSIGFNEENPKGFWERRDVIACNDAILEEQGCTWDALAGWEMKRAATGKTDDRITAQIKNILLELDGNRPWVMKDPRLCLTFPYWRKHLELPVIVTTSRDPVEVAISLQKRNHFSLAHGLAIWEYCHAGILNAVSGLPVIPVSHQEVLSQPVETVGRLFESLMQHGVQGLRLPSQQEITSFIEPSLYRSKADDALRKGLVTPHAAKIVRMIERNEAPEGIIEPSSLALDAMRTYNTIREHDMKLGEANSNFAARDQQCQQLSEELQEAQSQLGKIERHYVRQLAEAEARYREMAESTTWRIGNKFARAFRALTFRRA